MKAYKSADSIAVLSQLHVFELGMLREGKQPPGSSLGLKFVALLIRARDKDEA